MPRWAAERSRIQRIGRPTHEDVAQRVADALALSMTEFTKDPQAKFSEAGTCAVRGVGTGPP